MLFPTRQYAVFFVLLWLVYRRVGHRVQNWLLLAGSYYFYSCWDYRFLSLLVFSTAFDYWCGLRLAQAQDRRILTFSLAVNLGLLGVFKYYDFFVQSALAVMAQAGISLSPPLLHLVLPVGISFYTFQSLSYTIDVYRRRTPPHRDLVEYALFVAFFPHLVAGPIQRASWLLPQIANPRCLTGEMWDKGLLLLVVGLVRKVAIGDAAGALGERYFLQPGQFTSLELAVALCLFSLQIYGDFAGYSDMARGSAYLLGFELTPNFRHPYLATHIREFWTRWHISLSEWLRDYLYIPLGGNRGGPWRTGRNLMVTMFLGGLWHGASWNFVAWGSLHGLYLALWRNWRPPTTTRGRLAGIVATFTLVTFAWLFFRLQDWGQISLYLAGLTKLTLGGRYALLSLLLLGGLTLAIDLPQAITKDEFCFLKLPSVGRGLLSAGGILAAIFMGGKHSEPFIYFQF